MASFRKVSQRGGGRERVRKAKHTERWENKSVRHVCLSVTPTIFSFQGHYKVVKFLVDYVTQFPSDADLTRYINTLSDKVGWMAT